VATQLGVGTALDVPGSLFAGYSSHPPLQIIPDHSDFVYQSAVAQNIST